MKINSTLDFHFCSTNDRGLCPLSLGKQFQIPPASRLSALMLRNCYTNDEAFGLIIGTRRWHWIFVAIIFARQKWSPLEKIPIFFSAKSVSFWLGFCLVLTGKHPIEDRVKSTRWRWFFSAYIAAKLLFWQSWKPPLEWWKAMAFSHCSSKKLSSTLSWSSEAASSRVVLSFLSCRND